MVFTPADWLAGREMIRDQMHMGVWVDRDSDRVSCSELCYPAWKFFSCATIYDNISSHGITEVCAYKKGHTRPQNAVVRDSRWCYTAAPVGFILQECSREHG